MRSVVLSLQTLASQLNTAARGPFPSAGGCLRWIRKAPARACLATGLAAAMVLPAQAQEGASAPGPAAVPAPASAPAAQRAGSTAAQGKPKAQAARKPGQARQGKQTSGRKAISHRAQPQARPAPLVGSGPDYGQHEAALAFAREVAERRQLPLAWVEQALTEARRSPRIEQLILPPATPQAKNWRAYRARFLDEPRIQAGLRFWQAHAAELARAERMYGVPAEIVVGILGVETIYGREMGRFRVLDALSTLAFDFPAQHPRAAERSAFFRKELEHFLAQQHQSGTPVAAPLGSFAGARGMPQFMPSSQTHFAVDFDGDGRIDLGQSASDVIGSVAHYLQAFNWQRGMPTHYPVRFDESRLDMDALMVPDILPTFSVASFMAKGAVVDGSALAHPGPLALIELLNGGDAPSYVAGTENFYAITRYNWSSYYAMAVIELGQEIARRRSAR